MFSPLIRRSCRLLALLCCALLFGCGGGGKHTTPPVEPGPGDPMTPGPDPMPDPDDPPGPIDPPIVAQVGEIELPGGNGIAPQTQVLEFPMTALQLGVVKLEASTPDGQTSTSMLSRIGHEMAATETAPMSSGVSIHPVPRNGGSDVRARSFIADGKLRLELTNQVLGGETVATAPVTWRYQVERGEDPYLAATSTPTTSKTLTPGVPIVEALVRGRAGSKWHMQRVFRCPVEQDQAYKLTVTPLIGDPGWTYLISNDGHGPFEFPPIALGAHQWADYKAPVSGELRFELWAQAPENYPLNRMEAALVEVRIETTDLQPPRILSLDPSYRGLHNGWTIDLDGTPHLDENAEGALFFRSSGCPCDVAYFYPGPNGNIPAYPGSYGFLGGEAGERDILVQLTGPAGVSEFMSFHYRSSAQPPAIHYTPGSEGLGLPLLDPVEVPIEASWRVNSLFWDLGDDIEPRFSSALHPQIRMLRAGEHYVTVTAQNPQGETTRNLRLFAGPTNPPPPQPSIAAFGPLTVGIPTAFSSTSTPTPTEWWFSNEAPSLGSNPLVTFTQSGWMRGAMATRADGVVTRIGSFERPVNPAGTPSLSALRVMSPSFHEHALVAADWVEGSPFLVRAEGSELQFLHHTAYPAPVPDSATWDYAPPIAIPHPSSFQLPSVDLLPTPHGIYLLERNLRAGSPFRAWLLTPDTTNPLAIPWGDLLPDAEESGSFAISAWQDQVVITQAVDRDGQSHVVQAIFTPTATDPFANFSATELTSSVDFIYIQQQVSLESGVVVLIKLDEFAELIATPIVGGVPGTRRISSPYRVPYLHQQGGLIADAEAQLWFLSSTIVNEDGPATVWLNSASFADLTTQSRWLQRSLPPTPIIGLDAAYTLAQTSVGVEVMQFEYVHNRWRELRPVDNDWLILDRIDTLGDQIPGHWSNEAGDLLVLLSAVAQGPTSAIGGQFLVAVD